MGKLSTNNPKVFNRESFCLPQPAKTTNQIVFKPVGNRDQANSDSISGFLKKDLMIFHQNIRGLKDKTEETVNNIATNPPHILCFTEHHFESSQLDSILLQNYRLMANFCRTTHRNGGVCIYVHESLQSSNMEVQKYCKEKDLEVCSVRLYLPVCTIGVVNLYRSPLGSFDYFINELEILLNSISRNSMELIICGDFNINFSGDTAHKLLLNCLLATFGLYGTVNFPTRIYNNSITTIDNIFINTVNQNSISVYPWINGLSDHEAQIIVLHDIAVRTYEKNFYFCRRFNRVSATDLNLKLS